MSEQPQGTNVMVIMTGTGWINRADGTKEPIVVTSEPVLFDAVKYLIDGYNPEEKEK